MSTKDDAGKAFADSIKALLVARSKDPEGLKASLAEAQNYFQALKDFGNSEDIVNDVNLAHSMSDKRFVIVGSEDAARMFIDACTGLDPKGMFCIAGPMALRYIQIQTRNSIDAHMDLEEPCVKPENSNYEYVGTFFGIQMYRCFDSEACCTGEFMLVAKSSYEVQGD